MTSRRMLGFIALLALSAVRAADPQPSVGDETAVHQELEHIRDQLVALEIENALAAVNAILGRPGLPDATRLTALDLRAQAHVAGDDLDEAEKDYRAILELDAGYEPGRDVTSKKAMDRFARIRTSMIGTIHLDVEPADTSMTLDDRQVAARADGVFPAVAGERHLHLTRKGFDPQDVEIHVVSGQETLARVRLVPNARTLIVRTDVGGVAVTLDGAAAGVTARGSNAGSEAGEPAVLVIEDVGIGEHELRLLKPCFATETLQEVISVDLADRSPKLTQVVAMRPARARVTATGALYEAELRVDGERVASLPLTTFALCPGVRTVEVVASGRVVWSGVLDVEESDLTLDLAPRPNAVLVGTEWPRNWVASFSEWSLRDRLSAPPDTDLSEREGWRKLSLPDGTDLAVGVISRAGVAGEDRVVLYGPALHEIEDREPPRPSRPAWSQASLGVVLVDGGPGVIVVAAVSGDGPAARAGLLPGDDLVAISGRAVANAKTAEDAIGASAIGVRLTLDVLSPSGTTRKVECTTTAIPLLKAPRGADVSRVMRAAWASVDAAAGGPEASVALANLAELLERSGRNDASLDAWRRVRAMGGGALAARAAYAVGAGLESAGKRADAIEAFTQAKSAASAGGDAVLAAAAVDRLADLGVAPR